MADKENFPRFRTDFNISYDPYPNLKMECNTQVEEEDEIVPVVSSQLYLRKLNLKFNDGENVG